SAYRSVYSLVASYIEDPRLRQVFTFEPLLIGGNPMKVPGIYLLIHWLERKWGVHYAMGGTGALVRALVSLLGELGVTIRLNAPVARIECKGKKVSGVRLENGEQIQADMVISNADPTRVYSTMLDERLLSTNAPKKVQKKRQSMSLFVGYFGTNKKYPD